MVDNFNTFYNYNSSAYVEVTNTGDFIASFFVKYIIDTKEFIKESGILSPAFSRKIDIPLEASNIHILVTSYIQSNKEWVPIYNNTLHTPSIVKLTLAGTIFDPHCVDNDIKSSGFYYIKAINNSSLVAQLTIKYNFNGKRYALLTGDFPVNSTRTLNIPEGSTNIYIALRPSSGKLKILYPLFYEKNIPNPLNLELKFYGTLNALIVLENGVKLPPISDIPVKLYKFPNKTKASIGQEIELSLSMFNYSNKIVTNVILYPELLPPQAEFIKGSFKINNVPINIDNLPTKPMLLENLPPKNTPTIISYKIKFNAIPLLAPLDSTVSEVSYTFAEQPKVSFSYTDSNNVVKTMQLTGSVDGVTIVNKVNFSQYLNDSNSLSSNNTPNSVKADAYNSYLENIASFKYMD